MATTPYLAKMQTVLGRVASILFLAACTCGSAPLWTTEPSNTSAQPKKRAAFGYAYVEGISGPKRTVTTNELLSAHLTRAGVVISVIGTISDADAHTLLQLVGFQRSPRTTMLTGDSHFAILQIGDLKRDSCCEATMLFEKRVGLWSMLYGTWQSH